MTVSDKNTYHGLLTFGVVKDGDFDDKTLSSIWNPVLDQRGILVRPEPGKGQQPSLRGVYTCDLAMCNIAVATKSSLHFFYCNG